MSRNYLAIPLSWISRPVLTCVANVLGQPRGNAAEMVLDFARFVQESEAARVSGRLPWSDKVLADALGSERAVEALRAAGILAGAVSAGWYDAVGFYEEEQETRRDEARERSRRNRLIVGKAQELSGLPIDGVKEAREILDKHGVNIRELCATVRERTNERRSERASERAANADTKRTATRKRTSRARTAFAERSPVPTDQPTGLPAGLPTRHGSSSEEIPPGGPAAPEAVSGELVPSGPGPLAPMKAPPSNWVTRIGDVFAQRKGGIAPYGEVGRYLKPLHDLHGVEELERVTIAFLVAEDPTFATPKKLADCFGLHAGTHPARPLRPNGNGGGKRPPGSLPDDIFD